MRRGVRTQQVVAPRAKDVDTSARFAGSLLLSALAHTLLLTLILIGSWLSDDTEKLVSVGYKVELISLNPSKAAERTRVRPAPPKTITQAPAPKPVAEPLKAAKPEKVTAAPKIVPLKSEAPRKVADVEKPKKPEKVEAAEKLPPLKPIKPITPVAPVTPVRPPAAATPAEPSRPLPNAAVGGGGAASMVQGEETAYSWYMQIVNDRVNQNWVTMGIDIGGKRTNPVVRFDIDRTGAVQNARLETGSGAPDLDMSALRAVQTVSLPPLPPEYPTELMRIRFTFDYEQNHQ